MGEFDSGRNGSSCGKVAFSGPKQALGGQFDAACFSALLLIGDGD
jgi:hypothetical protein